MRTNGSGLLVFWTQKEGPWPLPLLFTVAHTATIANPVPLHGRCPWFYPDAAGRMRRQFRLRSHSPALLSADHIILIFVVCPDLVCQVPGDVNPSIANSPTRLVALVTYLELRMLEGRPAIQAL